MNAQPTAIRLSAAGRACGRAAIMAEGLLILATAFGCGDDGAKTADVLGAWFACANEDCIELAEDGFELGDDGAFVTLRLQSQGEDSIEYCEVPAGSFGFGNGELTLMPSKGEPRVVSFRVSDNRATLTNEDGESTRYQRVDGNSIGACVGVLGR